MALLHFLQPSKLFWIYYQQHPTSLPSVPLLFLLAVPVQPAVPSRKDMSMLKPKTLGELFDTPDVCTAVQSTDWSTLEH